jgi:hypothetical protein
LKRDPHQGTAFQPRHQAVAPTAPQRSSEAAAKPFQRSTVTARLIRILYQSDFSHASLLNIRNPASKLTTSPYFFYLLI